MNYLCTFSTVIFTLLAVGTVRTAYSQNGALTEPAWNGTRTALTSIEKRGIYLSVGSVTCHRPAATNQPEQYFHGTGQLTIAKDIVTTAAHNFINPSTCQPFTSAWACEFRMENGGSYPINMKESRFGISLKQDEWKGQKPGHCRTDKSEFVKDDWAVLKLGTIPLESRPYLISPIASTEYSGASVTEIAGYTQGFVKDGEETSTKEECRLEGKSPAGGTAALPLILANCGGGPGTSGSGLYLGEDGNPITARLIAIYHGPLNDHGKRTSLYVPIAGDFLAQLKAVASKN